MNRKKLIEEIKQKFMLNTYEAEIWLALLALGASTPSALAEATTVPRSRTYDTLENLEKKGLVIRRVGKPLTFIARSPEQALIIAKKRVLEKAKEKEKLIERFKQEEEFSHLQRIYSSLTKAIDIEKNQLSRRNNIIRHIGEQLAYADNAFFMVNTDLFFAIIYNLEASIKEVLKRKGKITIVIYDATPDLIQTIKSPKLKKLLEGIDIYFLNKDLQPLITIDDSLVIVFVSTEPHMEEALSINSPFLAKALKELAQIIIDKEGVKPQLTRKNKA